MYEGMEELDMAMPTPVHVAVAAEGKTVGVH
jgi:hypothetical protein